MDSRPMTEGNDIFVCRQCGDCCIGFGGTYVTSGDIIRIAEYIGSNPDQFTIRYCDKSGSRYVLSCSQEGCCIFFDKEKQCTIHPVKPYMCRAWPFINAVIRNPENWNIMANSCPGMKKDIPDSILQELVKKEKEKLDIVTKKNNS